MVFSGFEAGEHVWDRIVTDRPVTITDPRGTINSTGLEYDNKAKTLKLRSRVSGQLQPQSKSP